MTSWFMLGLQAMLAAAALHLVRWYVLPGLVRARQPQIIVDVWLPVAMAAPFVLAALRLGADVKGIGWTALGGPIVIAMLGAGFAMIAAHGRFDPFGERTLLHEEDAPALWPLPARIVGAALIAGLVLLMLGAAHMMTVWIGQAAFALAAIVLWINTPDDLPGSERPSQHETLAGWATIGVVLLAAGQAVASLWIAPEHVAYSALIMLAHAGVIVAMSAFIAGPGIASRLGLWAASVGVLASLGILSLTHVLPRAIHAWTAEYIDPQPPQVAYGFGAYAFEATALLVLAPAMIALARLERTLQIIAGIAILLAALALVAWRVPAMM
jgi:hypothetical protein